MVLFSSIRIPSVMPGKQRTKGKAPLLARAASKEAALPARPWDSTAPRAIRSRMMARTAKLPPQERKASRWALGKWLGGTMPAAAAAQAQAQAQPEAHGDEAQEILYMDDLGHVHLGVNPGDDREIFMAMRQMQAEEQQAAARAATRRVPAMAAMRRAAAAAGRREPKVQRPFDGRAAKRTATHACFQPRRQN